MWAVNRSKKLLAHASSFNVRDLETLKISAYTTALYAWKVSELSQHASFIYVRFSVTNRCLAHASSFDARDLKTLTISAHTKLLYARKFLELSQCALISYVSCKSINKLLAHASSFNARDLKTSTLPRIQQSCMRGNFQSFHNMFWLVMWVINKSTDSLHMQTVFMRGTWKLRKFRAYSSLACAEIFEAVTLCIK